MAVERWEHSGAAVTASLAGSLSDSDMSFAINTTSGWPTGATGPFVVVIDPGLSSEEKIKCASRSGTTVMVAVGGRGFDDTSPQAHNVSAVVRHSLSAFELDILNAHAALPTRDDHLQYQHNDNARVVTADHTYTGDPTFAGNPVFSGGPVFSGTPSFSNPPMMPAASYASAGDLTPLTPSDTASAGVSPKFMRADARPIMRKAMIIDAAWEIGDFKLTSVTGPIASNWLESNGSAFDPDEYPELAVLYPSHTLPDFRDKMLSGASASGTRQVNGEGGSDTATLTLANMASHSHTITDPGHFHSITDPGHKHGIGGDTGNRIVVTAAGTAPSTSLGGAQNLAYTSMDTALTGITATQSKVTGITSTNAAGSATPSPVATVPKWKGMRVLIKAKNL